MGTARRGCCLYVDQRVEAIVDAQARVRGNANTDNFANGICGDQSVTADADFPWAEYGGGGERLRGLPSPATCDHGVFRGQVEPSLQGKGRARTNRSSLVWNANAVVVQPIRVAAQVRRFATPISDNLPANVFKFSLRLGTSFSIIPEARA
jgi:hypothetical protein